VVTEYAAAQVRALIARAGNALLMLRVYIEGGGCSGFQYGFALEETVNEDDVVVETDGAKLLVDSLSFHYLIGAAVDYEEDLQGTRFVIQNPNAATTWGCGSSFSV
jgi:iron-sulfur cluster insertion protein